MNGNNNLLLDTNIVLYLLNGDETLIPLLEEKNLFVSFITELELLSYRELTEKDFEMISQFLNECTVIDIAPQIKTITIQLRQQYNLKLPDSIILATSIWLNIPVISSDQDFTKVSEAEIISYDPF
jgi:predicted nucleic acid-binding protein